MGESERIYRWDIAPEQFGVVIQHSLNHTATYYGPGHDIEIPVEIAIEMLSKSSELASLRQELARKEGTISRYAESLLLAWGGVCPRHWAIDGDPQSMAEQIRREGDRLQTENNSLNAELARKEEALEHLADLFESMGNTAVNSPDWIRAKGLATCCAEGYDFAEAALSPQADKENPNA